MKKLPIVFAALIAFAAPAHAGTWTPIRAEQVRITINELEADINRADQNGTISNREAADLRSRAASLRDEFQRKNANGLKAKEVRSLEARAARIRERLRSEKRDSNKRVG